MEGVCLCLLHVDIGEDAGGLLYTPGHGRGTVLGVLKGLVTLSTPFSW